MKRKLSGFTLVEVLIVVVIMAVLAATIIPQFTDTTADAKTSTSVFNLHTLRSQIEMYKSQHDGKTPSATLVELTSSTNRSGAVGSGASYPYGPYLPEIPENTLTGASTVKPVTNNPPVLADVTGTGGWLYHAASGRVWIDHADHFTE